PDNLPPDLVDESETLEMEQTHVDHDEEDPLPEDDVIPPEEHVRDDPDWEALAEDPFDPDVGFPGFDGGFPLPDAGFPQLDAGVSLPDAGSPDAGLPWTEPDAGVWPSYDAGWTWTPPDAGKGNDGARPNEPFARTGQGE